MGDAYMVWESLENKVVLVTGGARGIGKGLAQAALREGAKVVITNLNAEVGRNTATELSQHGEIRAVRCDATDREQVEGLLNDIWQREGAVDLVFSNAGAGGNERALDAAMKDVHGLFATNFESAVLMAQCYVPRMQKAGTPGHIMFTGSEHSVGLPKDNEDLRFTFYGATKHAMLIFAEWLRADLAGSNVTTSLLLPGPVLTESVAGTFGVLDENPNDPQIRQVFSERVEKVLRERVISTEACAEMALRGLKAGLFYIPTHGHIKDDIDRRYGEMSDAFEVMKLQA